MNKFRQVTAIAALLVAVGLGGGCMQQAGTQHADLVKLQNQVQELTEDLYRIHLELDTAATEISKAEAAIAQGNDSGAEYHAAEAYRSVSQADDDLIELGRALQKAANLDTKKGS
jgi:hypothetical protein